MYLIVFLLAMLVAGGAFLALSVVISVVAIIPVFLVIVLIPHRVVRRLVIGPAGRRDDDRPSAGVVAILFYLVMGLYGLVVSLFMLQWQISTGYDLRTIDLTRLPTADEAAASLRLLACVMGFGYGCLMLLVLILAALGNGCELLAKGCSRARRMAGRNSLSTNTRPKVG